MGFSWDLLIVWLAFLFSKENIHYKLWIYYSSIKKIISHKILYLVGFWLLFWQHSLQKSETSKNNVVKNSENKTKSKKNLTSNIDFSWVWTGY